MIRQRKRSRIWTLVILLAWSWQVMTVLHELGHLLGGLLGGGTLVLLEIRPWHLPYSFFSPDPRPLITLWAGPVVGVAVPMMVALFARRHATWFVAWFCLLANASYLLLGYLGRQPGGELDTDRLLAAGSSPAAIVLVSVVGFVIGYIGFRSSCVTLLSGMTPSWSLKQSGSAGMILLASVVIQAVVGSVLAR